MTVEGGRAITDLAVLRGAVLGWARPRLRDLPWRRTRDPWAILVSELMLQQTQVPRVAPRYEAFLGQFPTPTACANASTATVIAQWQGLGYNRRAVFLHRAAVMIRDSHRGRVPDAIEDLRSLPGIGPYTARAVLAFAYERDVAVVDTNVARLLQRWEGRTLTTRQRQERADVLVPAGLAWDWNQAMLDLGATVCAARQPACASCPVRPVCHWRGGPRPDPSGGRARQSRFAGSDRQGRGRLVDALRVGPVATTDLATVMGWPDDPERAARVASRVVADGLAVHSMRGLHLPGSHPST